MKKFLLSLAAVLCAGSLAMADEVTVQLNSSTGFTGGATAYTATSNGFTFTYAKANATNDLVAPSDDHIRIYKGATFTVEASAGVTITKMEMTSTESSYTGFDSAAPGAGSWDDLTYTWTGSANSVTLTSGTSQTRLKQIVITYTPASGVIVSTPQFSVAGGTYVEPVTVTITADDGCDIYYTTNGSEPSDESAFYENPITISETTTLKAIAYKGSASSGVKSATYTIVELREGAEGDGSKTNPFNAVAAYNEALVGSTAKVYVTGIISEISSIDTDSYGNASYYISVNGFTDNQFYIYRGYALGGQKFTSEDQIKVDDNVVVYGTLTTYNGVPQLAQGSEIVKLNGETYSADTEGDGSEANPYTVDDVIKLNPSNTSATEDQEKYWITGYIIGADNDGNTFDVSTDVTVRTNIALGATADATTGIPVQLPTGNVRNALNLADNPKNLGQQVTVYGHILKYYSVPGVKDTTDYKLGTVGIDAIDADNSDAPVEYFNLQGVRVDEPQNGLYIRRQGSTVTKVIVK